MPTRTPITVTATTLVSAALLVGLTGCIPSFLIPGAQQAPASTTAPEPAVPEVVETEAPVEEAPAATDVKGELISSEQFENSLQVDAYVLGYGESKDGSNWQDPDTGKDAYPKGTREVAVAFVLSNPSDAPLNVYGFSQTGTFEGSKFYSTTDSDSTGAAHILLGYDSAPYDTYGFDADEWPLAPGDTAYYATSIYLDGTTLDTSYSIKATGSDEYLRVDDVILKFKG